MALLLVACQATVYPERYDRALCSYERFIMLHRMYELDGKTMTRSSAMPEYWRGVGARWTLEALRRFSMGRYLSVALAIS